MIGVIASINFDTKMHNDCAVIGTTIAKVVYRGTYVFLLTMVRPLTVRHDNVH